MKRDFHTRLMYFRQNPAFGKAAYLMLKLLGCEIPLSVKVAPGCVLLHGGFGVVIHPKTILEENVRIYPGVTLGRADIHLPIEQSTFQGIRVEAGAILGSGAKILGKNGILVVGRGSIIGANAVLLESTSVNEIWAGVPARRVGYRGK